jgi:apolipoprotein N-acyltransferase
LVKIQVVLATLAPFFLVAAFEPYGLWFGAPIAYAIYLSVLKRNRFRILYSLYFGFSANLLILYWSGAYVGVLPWLALSILQALYFLPIGLLARFTSHLPALIVALLAMEEIKARLPFGGFSWTRIAFSQIDSPLASIVSIGGVLALSFATLLLSYLILTRKKSVAVLLLVLSIIPSLISLLPKVSLDKSLTFTAVQGGTPSKGLDFNSRAMGVLNMHIDESYRGATGREDLLIWPENAIDIDPLNNSIVRAKIDKLVTDLSVPLLGGAVLTKGPINAAILFNEDKKIGSMYFKRYLTPFGEYIPLRSISEFLSPYAARVDDFEAGEILKVHSVNGSKIASIICFEIINDGIVREAAKSSGLLVVHTNSATFAGTSEGDQQLAITRLRALEHNREIISISTTGPSAIMSARGEVLDLLQDGQIGSLSGEAKIIQAATIADYLGGFAPIATLAISLLWSALSFYRKNSSGKDNL